MTQPDKRASAQAKIWQMAAELAKLYPADAREAVAALIDDNIQSGDTERAEMWRLVLKSFDELLQAPTERN